MIKKMITTMALTSALILTGCGGGGNGGNHDSSPEYEYEVEVPKNSSINSEGLTNLGWYGKYVKIGDHSTVGNWTMVEDGMSYDYIICDFDNYGNEAFIESSYNGFTDYFYVQYGVSSDAQIVRLDTDYDDISDFGIQIISRINSNTYDVLFTDYYTGDQLRMILITQYR